MKRIVRKIFQFVHSTVLTSGETHRKDGVRNSKTNFAVMNDGNNNESSIMHTSTTEAPKASRFLRGFTTVLIGSLTLLSVFGGASPARAQIFELPSVTCPDNLNSCTANDVVTRIVASSILNNDTCAGPTDTLDLEFTFEFETTAANNYDVGVFVSVDGGTVQEPSSAEACVGAAPQVGDGDINAFPDADDDLFLDLDPNHTPADTCGDLKKTAGFVQWTVSASVSCTAVDGVLSVPACRVWQQNANHQGTCTDLSNVGTGSKCDCTPLVFPGVEFGTIKIIKVLDPIDDPGLFNLTIDGVVNAVDAGHNGTTGVIDVTVGDHIVGETAGTNTDLADYDTTFSCTDGTTTTTTTTVNVGAGEDWVCTITNKLKFVPAPSATISKEVTSITNPDLTDGGTTVDQAGDLIAYDITVTNTGNVPLDPVTVVDPLLTSLDCSVEDIPLAIGASTVCMGTYTVLQSNIDANGVDDNGVADGDGDIDNTATVTFTGGGITDTLSDSAAVPVSQSPALTIVKTATPTTYSAVDDVINYSYLVTNTGNVTISAISVSDDQAANESCAVTELAPGENTTCTASDTITQADLDAGSLTNIASATGTPAGGTLVDPSDTETVNAVQSPALTIVKTATPTTYSAVDDVINYSYLVTNTGNVTISGPISVADNNVDAAATCPAGDLAASGGTTTCTAQHTITQADLDAGSVTNVASASGTDPNGNPVTSPTDTETVTAIQNPSLSIVKTATPATYDAVGQVISYSYLVTNDGNVTISGPISVSDDQAANESCPAGNLAPGDSLTCTASDTITQADLDAGSVTNVASASGTDPNGNPVTSPTDTETVTAIQNPAVQLDKTGTLDLGADGIANPGDLINYTFKVTNTGNVTLSNISVSDPMVASITCPSGNPIPSLSPEAMETCTGSYALTQADIDAGQKDNTALASGTDPNGNPVQDPGDHSEPVPQTPGIEIVKASSLDLGADGIANPGDVISYSFTVTNTGNVTLSNVTVNDAQAGVTNCVIGAMAPLAVDSSTCSGTYALTQADVDAGQVDNQAFVNGTDPNGNDVPDDDTDTEPVPQTPGIEIVKGFDPASVTAGTDGAFTLLVTNTGNVTLSDALIEDVVDTRLTVTSVSGTLGSDADTDSNAQTVEWLITTLSVNQSATITVDFSISASVQADLIDNVATVGAEAPLGDPDDPTDDVTDTGQDDIDVLTSSDLRIAKDDGVTQVTAGDGVTYQYTITVNNDGPSDADNVTVTEDSFPAGFDMGTVSSSHGGCAAFPCNLGTIVSGGSATIAVSYTVPSDTQAGFETNTVSVTSDEPDPDPSNNTDSDTNEVVTSSDLSIAKDDGVTQVMAGDGVTYQYTITVNNAGPSNADNVTVTEDSFPAGFDMGAVSSSQGGCAGFPCNLGIVGAGGSATITVQYTVPSDTQAGFQTNTVSVTSSEPDPNPSGNTASDTNEVLTSADLRIAKDDDVTQVTAGDGVTYQYTITVNNDGPSDADNVTVTDSFPAGFDIGTVSCPFPCNLGTIVSGGSAAITVQYTVPSDTLAGFETNTVSVTSDDPDPDPSNNTASDTNEVLTEIELSIVKNFYRFDDNGTPTNPNDDFRVDDEDDRVEQGTMGYFDLTVSNAGPSDALGVSVTDLVESSLYVVMVTPQPECAASAGQLVDCTFDIAAGDSVTITVEYEAAPFLDPDVASPYGTQEGDDFRFVFVNGYILEGSSDTDGAATVIVTAPDGTETILPYDGTRNEVNFDPPGDDPVFTIHLSCSDPFIGGWGSGGGTNGPVEGVDVNWQISSYSILRYNQNGFFKGCGDVVEPQDVPNTAFADGVDSNSPEGIDPNDPNSELRSGPDSVQVIRQLKIEIRNQPVIKGKKMDVLLNNVGMDVLTITKVELTWPSGNGELQSVLFGLRNTIWTGVDDAPDATITEFEAGSDLTIDPGEALKLGFFFQNKTDGGTYTITVTLEGGLTEEMTTITADL